MIDKKTRLRMEDHLYGFLNKFDPSGKNTEYYKNKFNKMNDKEFYTFFKTLFDKEEPYLTVTMIDYENPVEMKNLEAAAKHINVPIFERIVLPYASPDPNNPIVTKYECLVGYLHLKRMQQINFKKLGISTDTAERNMLTNQVTGHDKNSRNSDAETNALLTIGAHKALKEFMSARADDMVMKNQMNRSIINKGYVALDELEDNVLNKTALNTVSVFFLGAGIKTDLVTNDWVLPKTLKK